MNNQSPLGAVSTDPPTPLGLPSNATAVALTPAPGAILPRTNAETARAFQDALDTLERLEGFRREAMSADECARFAGVIATIGVRDGVLVRVAPLCRWGSERLALSVAGDLLVHGAVEQACQSCQGRGSYPDPNGTARNSTTTCPSCEGRGWVAVQKEKA